MEPILVIITTLISIIIIERAINLSIKVKNSNCFNNINISDDNNPHDIIQTNEIDK